MILRRALRLAAENAALRRRNQQLARDSELLGLMARDRTVALQFIRTAHAIDKQETR